MTEHIEKVMNVEKMVREIQWKHRCANDYVKERDQMLSELNGILVETGGQELTLEEVLKIE